MKIQIGQELTSSSPSKISQTVIVFHEGNPRKCPLGGFVKTADIGAKENCSYWRMIDIEEPKTYYFSAPTPQTSIPRKYIVFERVITQHDVIWKRVQ